MITRHKDNKQEEGALLYAGPRIIAVAWGALAHWDFLLWLVIIWIFIDICIVSRKWLTGPKAKL